MGTGASTVAENPIALQLHATEAAAVVIQAVVRGYLLRQCEQQQCEQQQQSQQGQQLAPHSLQEDGVYRCSMDQLAIALDSTFSIQHRLPFVRGATQEAKVELERVLSFLPGTTLRCSSATDMAPARLRSCLVGALRDGLTLLIDLDAGEEGESEDTELKGLLDMCGDAHFPAQMLLHPASAFDPAVYAPLVDGNLAARPQAARFCRALGLSPEGADINAVRRAHRRLVLQHHPDRMGGDEKAFRAVQEAYEALTDGVPLQLAQNEEGGEEGEEEEQGGFAPRAGFKIVLLSRRAFRAPADVRASCATIIASKAPRVLREGMERPVVTNKYAASGEDPGEYLQKMEALRCAAQFEENRRMEGRVHTDDAQEAARRLCLVEQRVGRQRRRLRSSLFRLAATAPPTTAGGRGNDSDDDQDGIAATTLTVLRNKVQALDDFERRLNSERAGATAARAEQREATRAADAGCDELGQRAGHERAQRLAAHAKLKADKPEAFAALATVRRRLHYYSAASACSASSGRATARGAELAAEEQRLVRDIWGEHGEPPSRSAAERALDANYALRRDAAELAQEEVQRHYQAVSSLFKDSALWDEAAEQERREQQTRATRETATRDVHDSAGATIDMLRAAVLSKHLGNSEALVEAAFEGDLATVKALLLKGFDLESHDARGFTALSDASCNGQDDVVQLLLDLGADPNTCGMYSVDDVRTPLGRASFNCHASTMSLLLAAGAYAKPARLTVPHGDMLTHQLLGEWDTCDSERVRDAREGRLELQLEETVSRFSPEEQAAHGVMRARAELRLITEQGDAAALKARLAEHAIDEVRWNSICGGGSDDGRALAAVTEPRLHADSSFDNEGRSLLHLAAWKGHAPVVEMLLTEWKRLGLGVCGLADAVDDGSSDMMAVRVFRTDVNRTFGWNGAAGWTALAVAAHCGHAETVRLLRIHGANPLLGTEFHADAFALARGYTSCCGPGCSSGDGTAALRLAIGDFSEGATEGAEATKLLRSRPVELQVLRRVVQRSKEVQQHKLLGGAGHPKATASGAGAARGSRRNSAPPTSTQEQVKAANSARRNSAAVAAAFAANDRSPAARVARRQAAMALREEARLKDKEQWEAKLAASRAEMARMRTQPEQSRFHSLKRYGSASAAAVRVATGATRLLTGTSKGAVKHEAKKVALQRHVAVMRAAAARNAAIIEKVRVRCCKNDGKTT